MWCRCSRCLTTESSKESKGENHKARKRARGGQPLWLRIYEFLPRDLPICSFCVLYQSNDVDIRSITFNRPPLQILPATLNAAVAICSQRGLLLQLSFGETVFFPYLDFSSAFCVVCQTCCTLFFSIHLLSLRLQQCRLPLSSLLCRRLCCRRSGRQHTQRAAQPAAQPFAQRLVRPEGGERRLAAKMTAELCPRAGYSARRTAGCTNTAGAQRFVFCQQLEVGSTVGLVNGCFLLPNGSKLSNFAVCLAASQHAVRCCMNHSLFCGARCDVFRADR